MSNQHGQASRVPTDQGVIVTPLKISFTIHAINQCRSVLQNRVRILIVVARVDFFQKGIKKSGDRLPSTTLVHLSRPSGRSYWERTQVLSNCWTSFDWVDADSLPSRPSGREWRYVLSHFRNIIYGANTRKHSKVMSEMPIGSSPFLVLRFETV